MNLYDVLLYKKLNGGGGGGTASLERLRLVTYIGLDTEEIPVVDNIDEGEKYADYLSYDSTTKKFTVLKNFDAIVTPWVNSYRTASSTRASGEFYINDIKVKEYVCESTAEGTKAGAPFAHSFHKNDTFYNYTPSSDGYPQQMLKVYKLEGITASELNGAFSFEDEEI